MMDRQHGFDRYSLEEDIRKYPEVVTCQVHGSEGKGIKQVDVLLREGTRPDEFETLLKELLTGTYGLLLPPSALNIESNAVSAETPKNGSAHSANGLKRPKISNIVFIANSTNGEAQVTLDVDQREGTGQASGHLTSQQRLRLIAEATLLAVEDLADRENQFTVESISEVTLLDQPIIVVLVHCFEPVNKVLSGSCPVADDGSIDHAVVRATLAAINRVTSRILELPSRSKQEP